MGRKEGRVIYCARLLALYKGIVPKIMRLGPGGAIMLLVYEYMHDYLVTRWLHKTTNSHKTSSPEDSGYKSTTTLQLSGFQTDSPTTDRNAEI